MYTLVTMSANNSDDAFIPDIDDIHDEIDESSRKTSPIWSYITCKSSSHPGVPVCKKCGFAFSVRSGNSSIERHLLSKHCIVIPKV